MGHAARTWLLNPVVHGLLGSEVLPRAAAPFEKVSAAMAVRYAVSAKKDSQTFIFLVPDTTSTTARHIAAGLLIGNYAHERGHGRLPPEESHSFLKGNVLFVTPAVSECVAQLEGITFAGTTPLKALWDIVPLARPGGSSANRQRLFVANPGWVETRVLNRRFSAVILDATHPRTLSQFPELLRLARQVSHLCIAVSPVISQGALSELAKAAPVDLWLWDPVTRANAQQLAEGFDDISAQPSSHTLWVCAEDPEADALLEGCHRRLVGAMRAATGRHYPGLALAWSIVNRLRTLTLPLADLEEAAAKTWVGGLAERIRALALVSGHGDAVWDSTWPELRGAVESAFQGFLARKESAKFWALAVRLEAILRAPTERYRIVTSSSTEAVLLSSALQDVVDGFSSATEAGCIEIVSSQEEARRIAEGSTAHTILTGARLARYRYLNVYPSQATEELLYPFEATLEEHALVRQYQSVALLQEPSRIGLLERMELTSLSRDVTTKPSRPKIEVKRADGKEVLRVRESVLHTELDLDELASAESSAPSLYRGSADRGEGGRQGPAVEVIFTNGVRQLYGLDQYVDVYFSETDQIQRQKTQNLAPGMRVIWFVDGRYDSLFRRSTEAIEKRWSTQDRVALALWDRSKEILVGRHPNKRELYENLCNAGLTSTYATFCAWVRDEDETMAPQQFPEFAVFAKATGAFRTEKLIADTFRCIQQVRGRNRRVGRNLKSLLRALHSQAGYEEALESMRQIDPDLADVYAAVDVLEISGIRRLEQES